MAATGSNGQQTQPLVADEPWVGIPEAAAHLGLPVRTVYRLAQAGGIPATKVGRTWRFKRSILDAHLHADPRLALERASHAAAMGDRAAPVDGAAVGSPEPARPLLETAAALADLSAELAALREVTEIGEVLAARLAEIFRIELVGLLQRDGTDLVTVTARGDLDVPAGHRFASGTTELGARIASTDSVVAIEDIGSVARSRIVERLGVRSVLFVPIQTPSGPWGLLALATRERRRFHPFEIERLVAIAGQTGLALANAALLAESTRRGEQLERRLASQRQLLAITERLLVTRERDAIFSAVADTLADVVPHDTLTIYLVDREAGRLVPILARDAYADQILATRPALGEGITGSVLERGEAELINDAKDDPRVVHIPGTPAEDESMIVAPIRGRHGPVGSLNLYRTGRHFDEDDLELARLFTNHVAIALENAAVHDRLLTAARTDPLTGLPNRRLFAERVEQAIARRQRHGGQIAVLFLDLDGFKLVNDGLGHGAGDRVLVAVGERLRRCVRTEDTVARLGGDEFGILLEDATAQDDALVACQRVAEALDEPIAVDGRRWVVRASIGVALDEAGSTSAHALLRDADTAMYRAKGSGRGVAMFEPSMHAAQLARLELDTALREAVGRDELSVRFQPIVDVGTGEVAAIETLLRWEHPARGLVSPAEFIPVAEETGEILGLGLWVLGEACRTLAGWRASGVAPESVIVTVNTSVRQLVDPEFPAEVERALASAGLPADRLLLEVTESVVLADETAAVPALRRLRDRGVHVAVDDFGTGYSSLGQLRRLPVDGIKIDRTFVDGLGIERDSEAIVDAALAFARALDLSVTAEGVETDVQLELLAGLGCRFAQGYRFAPPLTRERAAELLASRRRFAVPSPTLARGNPAA